MKYFILGFLALPFLFTNARTEVIDSVMYNPARLGQYEKLKVSNKASFKGGVKTNTMTVQSGGAVTINNAGDYQINNTQAQGAVYLPVTHMAAPSVNAAGGTARFIQSGQTSSIREINRTLPRLKANVLKMNAVTVSGQPAAGYEGQNLKGLQLGGNDIPAPDVNCSSLGWFARAATDGKTYNVLGLGSCEGGACTPKYGVPKLLNLNTTDTCPGTDGENQYTCSGGYEGVCTDIFKEYSDTSIGSGGGQSNTNISSVSNPNFVTDSCDGDKLEMYTCSAADKSLNRTCTDVYGNINASLTSQDDRICPPVGTEVICSYAVQAIAAVTALDAIKNPDAACRRIVAQSPSGGTCGLNNFSYGGSGMLDPGLGGCRYPSYNGRYYISLTCKPAYFQRTVKCSSGSSGGGTLGMIRQRAVNCCVEKNPDIDGGDDTQKTYTMHALGTSCNPSNSIAMCHNSLAVEGKACSSPMTCCVQDLTTAPSCPTGMSNLACQQWQSQYATGRMWECR